MNTGKKISAEEFDRRFDAGEDMTPYLDLSTARRHNEERRLTVHVSGQVAEELEREAVRQGVTKQRLIEDWITDRARSILEAHTRTKDRPRKGEDGRKKKKNKAPRKQGANASKLR